MAAPADEFRGAPVEPRPAEEGGTARVEHATALLENLAFAHGATDVLRADAEPSLAVRLQRHGKARALGGKELTHAAGAGQGMRILDISPVVSESIGVWPGDVKYRARKSLEIEKGANIDLGSIETTYHVGAHVDAPLHYAKKGKDAAAMPLSTFYGPCQVVRVEVARGERIRPKHVAEQITAPRVLFHTGTFPNPDQWNNDFAALSAELVDWLAAQKVVLVGIDTPSIDLFDDKVLESHQACGRHGMANLEGIALDEVKTGLYILAAFPLRLAGADASPVRAVLVQDS